jgi:2-hydroxy-3-keto-5-methylthiopentenyl-1-phosphate phosphatase
VRKIAVLCDFDGTVAQDDVGTLLFRQFADRAKADEIVEQWKKGTISSRECLEREAALAHASREELDRFACQRKLDPYFKDFVDFARRREIEIVVVSDGLDQYIEKMLMRSGLGELEFFANAVHIVEQTLEVRFPYHNMLDCKDCGNCKTFHLEKYRAAGYYIVYVGNGLSDRCPCQSSDLVFAKGELAEFCRSNGLSHVEFRNFRDVEREMVKRFVLSEEYGLDEEVGGL